MGAKNKKLTIPEHKDNHKRNQTQKSDIYWTCGHDGYDQNAQNSTGDNREDEKKYGCQVGC